MCLTTKILQKIVIFPGIQHYLKRKHVTHQYCQIHRSKTFSFKRKNDPKSI